MSLLPFPCRTQDSEEKQMAVEMVNMDSGVAGKEGCLNKGKKLCGAEMAIRREKEKFSITANKMEVKNNSYCNKKASILKERNMFEISSDLTETSKSSEQIAKHATHHVETMPLIDPCSTILPLTTKNALSCDTEESYISAFSDEIILLIFKHLPQSTLLARCARVCKKWHRLSHDKSLWKVYQSELQWYAYGSVSRLLKCGVEYLDLSRTMISEPVFSPSISFPFCDNMGRFSQLRCLNLVCAIISSKGIQEVLSACSGLIWLSLESLIIDENVCKQIAANKNLEFLNLSMTIGLTPECISTICQNCTSLRGLNLGWTKLPIQCLNALSSSAPASLRELSVSGMVETAMNKHVKAIIQRCPNLTCLDVSDCYHLTGDVIKIICDSRPHHFRELFFSRCFAIKVEAYRLLRQVKSLQYLEIFHCTCPYIMNELQVLMPNVTFNRTQVPRLPSLSSNMPKKL